MQSNLLPSNPDKLAEQFYLKDDLLQTKIVILITFFLFVFWAMEII